MTSQTDQAMAETVAYVALRRLQRSYADAVTLREWERLAELMRPNCVLHLDLVQRQMTIDGPAAIGDFIGTQLEQFEFFQFLILNTVFDIDVATGTAAARMHIQEARTNTSDGRRSDTYGIYHDRFERGDDGRWWFAERHYRSAARTKPGDNPGGALEVLAVAPIDLAELRTR